MRNNKILKVIVSGGGTGGHIFPALSIADGIKQQHPDVDILFVGALGRMEMDIVPKAGYQIIGLPVKGLIRKITFQNVVILYQLWKSLRLSRKIVKDFKPDVVVGVGGYASGPLIRSAAAQNIPAVIQEQNSYAGVTNKLLAKKAQKICVAYDKMERFFPADKIVFTGNPIRKALLQELPNKQEALNSFNIRQNKRVVLVIGGSLGARSVNRGMQNGLALMKANPDVFFIWQTGKSNYSAIQQALGADVPKNVMVTKFIDKMDYAFAAADIIVSRAGAGTISELCLVGKPVILVPSPNVAEDHQTKNAMALVDKDAAILLKDKDAETQLVATALEYLGKANELEQMSKNIKLLAKPDATKTIVDVVLKQVRK